MTLPESSSSRIRDCTTLEGFSDTREGSVPSRIP